MYVVQAACAIHVIESFRNEPTARPIPYYGHRVMDLWRKSRHSPHSPDSPMRHQLALQTAMTRAGKSTLQTDTWMLDAARGISNTLVFCNVKGVEAQIPEERQKFQTVWKQVEEIYIQLGGDVAKWPKIIFYTDRPKSEHVSDSTYSLTDSGIVLHMNDPSKVVVVIVTVNLAQHMESVLKTVESMDESVMKMTGLSLDEAHSMIGNLNEVLFEDLTEGIFSESNRNCRTASYLKLFLRILLKPVTVGDKKIIDFRFPANLFSSGSQLDVVAHMRTWGLADQVHIITADVEILRVKGFVGMPVTDPDGKKPSLMGVKWQKGELTSQNKYGRGTDVLHAFLMDAIKPGAEEKLKYRLNQRIVLDFSTCRVNESKGESTRVSTADTTVTVEDLAQTVGQLHKDNGGLGTTELLCIASSGGKKDNVYVVYSSAEGLVPKKRYCANTEAALLQKYTDLQQFQTLYVATNLDGRGKEYNSLPGGYKVSHVIMSSVSSADIHIRLQMLGRAFRYLGIPIDEDDIHMMVLCSEAIWLQIIGYLHNNLVADRQGDLENQTDEMQANAKLAGHHNHIGKISSVQREQAERLRNIALSDQFMQEHQARILEGTRVTNPSANHARASTSNDALPDDHIFIFVMTCHLAGVPVQASDLPIPTEQGPADKWIENNRPRLTVSSWWCVKSTSMLSWLNKNRRFDFGWLYCCTAATAVSEVESFMGVMSVLVWT